MKKELYEYLFTLRSSGFMHTTQHDLQDFVDNPPKDLSFPEAGQREGIREGSRGSLSENKIKDIRNFMIGSCFFSSSYIVEHGGDAEYAYGVSDYYLNKLDHAINFKDYQNLYREMSEAFVELYAGMEEEMRRKETASPLIVRTTEYIRQHLYSNISASDAARFAGRDTSYLSSLFKAETGLTLQKFILQEKINESKVMMRETNEKIRDIAEALGFSSAAHFTRVFRQYEGITPQKWRMQKGIIRRG